VGRQAREGGLGSIPLNMLERSDVGRGLNGLAAGGRLSRRSIQICRLVLRAALDDAVHLGVMRQSPAARVALPRNVARPGLVREVKSWDRTQVVHFLDSSSGHRWAAPLRLAVLYGLRRSELLALKWDDIDVVGRTVRIDEGLVDAGPNLVWPTTKNAHSRRTIPIDATTAEPPRPASARATGGTAAGRQRVGGQRSDGVHEARSTDHPSQPRPETLRRVVAASGLPKLTSHGLRHTAATQMVRQPTTSATCERWPMCSATARICSCGCTRMTCPMLCGRSPIASDGLLKASEAAQQPSSISGSWRRLSV
jgi:integrase